MSEIPELTSEELYKNLYEKVSKEKNEYFEQVTSLEIVATKIRDQRDNLAQRLERVEEELNSLKASEEPLEGEVLD